MARTTAPAIATIDRTITATGNLLGGTGAGTGSEVRVAASGAPTRSAEALGSSIITVPRAVRGAWRSAPGVSLSAEGVSASGAAGATPDAPDAADASSGSEGSEE